MNGLVLCEEREGSYWLTLNRPEALNAFSSQLLSEFTSTLQRIGNSGLPLIITGAGRAFSAGGDLKEFLALLDDPAALRVYFEDAAEMMMLVAHYPGFTLAAVNGLAVAGGMELLCVCDAAVAAESAQIGDGHINFGLHPGGGASVLLGRLIGERRARWLMLSGELIPAAEAQRIGLVNRVVADSELEEAAMQMAGVVSRHSPGAVRRLKRLLAPDLAHILAAERESLLDHFRDPETRRALAGFAASRGGTPRS